MAADMTEVEKIDLRDARIDAGFNNQEALALEAGVSEPTIWNAEHGRTIAYRSARRIVNALNRVGQTTLKITDLTWSVSEKV